MGQRLGDFLVVNSLGQPIEEAIAISHFILGGVPDRHPELNVVIAHGDGFYTLNLSKVPLPCDDGRQQVFCPIHLHTSERSQ
jgi:hypothetical protein